MKKEDTTYVISKSGVIKLLGTGDWKTRRLKFLEMKELPEDHQAKISILNIAISDHYISGVGIRSDDAVSWGTRYIIEN